MNGVLHTPEYSKDWLNEDLPSLVFHLIGQVTVQKLKEEHGPTPSRHTKYGFHKTTIQ